MCVCVCACVRACGGGEGRGAAITDRYVHQSVECQECLYTCQIKDGGTQPQVPALRITAGFCFFFPSFSENLLCDRHSVSK